jgi:hypothetical protein
LFQKELNTKRKALLERLKAVINNPTSSEDEESSDNDEDSIGQSAGEGDDEGSADGQGGQSGSDDADGQGGQSGSDDDDDKERPQSEQGNINDKMADGTPKFLHPLRMRLISSSTSSAASGQKAWTVSVLDTFLKYHNYN